LRNSATDISLPFVSGEQIPKNEFVKALHEWSEGWSSHMHNALLGLTRELLKSSGDLAMVSPERSLAHAPNYRNRYNTNRMGTVFNILSYFLGEFMTRLNSKRIMPAADIYNHIKQAKKKATEDFYETNIGRYSVEELFNHLLHQGFIQPNSSGDYVCPIPSLRS